MRAAKNAKNLNNTKDIEAEIKRYKNKKIKLGKIQTYTDNTGQCWNIIYYNSNN